MPKSRSETTRKNIGERNLNQYALTLVVFVSALGLYGKDVVTGGVVAVAGYVVKDLITDNVKLTSKLSDYYRLYQRVYANEVYNLNYTIKGSGTAEGEITYKWTTSVIRVVDKKVTFCGDSTNAFVPTANAYPSYESQFTNRIPDAVPLEIRKSNCQIDPSWKESLTTSFAYRINWEFNGTPLWYWRRARNFRIKCLNWEPRQINCEEYYKGTGAEYLTEQEIPVNVKPGGQIWCKSYVAGPPGWEFGVVNIDPGDKGHLVFEVVQ